MKIKEKTLILWKTKRRMQSKSLKTKYNAGNNVNKILIQKSWLKDRNFSKAPRRFKIVKLHENCFKKVAYKIKTLFVWFLHLESQIPVSLKLGDFIFRLSYLLHSFEPNWWFSFKNYGKQYVIPKHNVS